MSKKLDRKFRKKDLNNEYIIFIRKEIGINIIQLILILKKY